MGREAPHASHPQNNGLELVIEDKWAEYLIIFALAFNIEDMERFESQPLGRIGFTEMKEKG